jgi:hypothetical protein
VLGSSSRACRGVCVGNGSGWSKRLLADKQKPSSETRQTAVGEAAQLAGEEKIWRYGGMEVWMEVACGVGGGNANGLE